MIIGLSGYAGSGKDLVGKIIQYLASGAPQANIKFENWDGQRLWGEKASTTNWEIKKWAFKLKQIASILTGIPQEMFEDQEFKKTFLPEEWNYEFAIPFSGPEFTTVQRQMTVRQFLQDLGTDALRDGLHTNVWVNALMADYRPSKMSERNPSKWIITDCRFPNEAEAVKERGGLMIRIDRPGIAPINDHPSETRLDNYPFDYRIANASDIPSLIQTVEVILKKENLL